MLCFLLILLVMLVFNPQRPRCSFVQAYINQEPLFSLQSIAAMWIETLRPQVSSVGFCFSNIHVQGEQEEVGQG